MNPALLDPADWDGLIWLVERAAVGCVHLNESAWASQLRQDANRLKATRDKLAGAAPLDAVRRRA